MGDLPRIYVASLSDYNCGELHGVWIEIDESTDTADAQLAIDAMLAASPSVANGDSGIAEEYAIHDCDNFYGYRVEEYQPIGEVVRVGNLIAEHGPAFGEWLKVTGRDVDDDCLGDRFTEAFLGERSALDYAYDYVAETGMLAGVDETVRVYFDYEAFARDLLLGGDITVSNGFLFDANV